MKKAIVAAAIVLAANAAGARTTELPFLAQVAQADLAEVAMGRLAESRAMSDRVRNYGRMLAADHDAHRGAVQALAEARRIKLPPAISAEQRAVYDRMAQMQGAAFDEAFKAHMIADRQKIIAATQALLAAGDTEVAALAERTLPVLERHLAAAEKL